MGAMGGFRPATLMEFKYDQVVVAAVRDPEDRTKARLVASLLVYQNKQKEFTIKFDQSNKYCSLASSTPSRILTLTELLYKGCF